MFGGKSEIKKSLKTKLRKEAKVSAALCRYEVEALFHGIRWGMISEEQANKIRSRIIGETVEDLRYKNDVIVDRDRMFEAAARIIDGEIKWYNFPKDKILDLLSDKLPHDTEYLKAQVDGAKNLLNKIDNNLIHPHMLLKATHMTDEFNLDISASNVPCDNSRYIEFDDTRLNRDLVDLCVIVSKTVANVILNEGHKHGLYYCDKSFVVKQYKDGLPDPKLSELWDAYYQDKTIRNEWRGRTAEKYASSYKIVLDILGNLELSQFDAHVVKTLTVGLQHYPKNKNKLKQFKDKPFSKAMAKVPGFLAFDPKSINFILGMMSGLFKFALEDRRLWRIDNNPFYKKQIKIDQQKESQESRREFTTAEINRIFGELCKVRRLVEPEKFWVPLICLYSGMRINEACQLRLKDIEIIDEVPVFQIRHNPKQHQETKNGKSRTVPVHKTLQDLGFLAYVTRQKTNKEERVFSNLKLYKGKWHKKVDNWFNRTV